MLVEFVQKNCLLDNSVVSVIRASLCSYFLLSKFTCSLFISVVVRDALRFFIAQKIKFFIEDFFINFD